MTYRLRTLLVDLALAGSSVACGDAPSTDELTGRASTTSIASAPAPTDDTTTSRAAPSTAPTVAPDPTVDPGDGSACIGTRLGLSCLVDGEWENFDRDNSPIYDWVQSVDLCPDGRILAITLDGVATHAGGRWTEIPAEFSVSGPDAVACGTDAIWAGFFGWVGRFQNGEWTFWDSEEVLGTTDFVKTVNDVAISPDGIAWVATSSSIARFDGEWTVWEEGAGFDVGLSPTAVDVDVAADGTYTVYVAAGFRGIARFSEGQWTLQEAGLNGARDIAAADGTVLVPAFRNGATSYEGIAATPVTVADGLSSDTVRGIAIDDAGRQWFATSYGLTVLTDDGARTYRVDNSGLLDNDTYAVAVGGGGPVLPGEDPRPPSGLSGIVTDDTGTPLAGITVEACVDELRDEFDGETPCSDHPFSVSTVTAADGRFEVGDLPAGRYTIALQSPAGWTRVVDGSVAARYAAPAGEIADLGVITLSG